MPDISTVKSQPATYLKGTSHQEGDIGASSKYYDGNGFHIRKHFYQLMQLGVSLFHTLAEAVTLTNEPTLSNSSNAAMY
jgi:hypothetical protein